MEKEDHYGDLQELFYASKDGDLIFNKTTSEFGIYYPKLEINEQEFIN